MAHYMVYWPQDRVEELKKAGDRGPIKVVLGSIHSRMPTIVSIKVGDVVFPVTLMKKRLYAMARLPVTHRECAFNYCVRELGRQHGALIPQGVVLESGGGENTYYLGVGTVSTTIVLRMYRKGPALSLCRSRWRNPISFIRNPSTVALSGQFGEKKAVPLTPDLCPKKLFPTYALATLKARRRL